MRKSLLLFFALIFLAKTFLLAQNDSLRSLEQALENAKDHREKAAALNKLTTFQLRSGEFSKAEGNARAAVELAEKHGLSNELAQAKDNLGQVFESKYDYSNAMKTYFEALKLRESAGDETAVGQSKHLIGHVFLLQEDFENAQANLEKALEIRQKNAKNQADLAETNRILGDLWRKKKVLGKAQEHYRNAIDQKIEANDLPAAAQIAGQLGKLVFELGDYEGSLVYFRQSFDLNSSVEDLRAMGHDLLNIGSALRQQQAFGEAESAFTSAAEMFREAKDTLALVQTFENQSRIFLKTGRRAEAEATLASAENLLSAIQAVPGVPETYAKMAETYRESGNLAKAYECLLNFTTAKEKVFGFEKNKALLELSTRYQSEFAAEEQKRTIERLEVQKNADQQVRWALLGILAFAVFAVWALLKSNRTKRRDNKLLQSKNAEIDAKNRQMADQNNRLDELNRRLVGEIANRELLEQTAFNRDQFLTVLSREMRTPMVEILAHTRTLLAEKPRNGRQDALLNIQYSANNLLVLINDLLDYSNIEAGKIILENVEFDVKKTVAEVEKRFVPAFREKAIELRSDFDVRIPGKLIGDPARFGQILNNVFSNVVQNTEGGDIRLHLTGGEETLENFTLKIELNALGSLLNPVEIEALNHPNLASVESELGDRAGQAIGLVLTKRLVALQNGRFNAENFGTEGAVFSLDLPFKKINKKLQTIENENGSNRAPLEGKYILVAEDNKINQLVVQKMLQKAGAVVVVADDGLAALDAFRSGYFDLILMDIQMPKLDGYRTVAEMRQSEDPMKKKTPIIALTASAYLTDKDKAELFQMNDHIGKPFSPEELLEKVVAVARRV